MQSYLIVFCQRPAAASWVPWLRVDVGPGKMWWEDVGRCGIGEELLSHFFLQFFLLFFGWKNFWDLEKGVKYR